MEYQDLLNILPDKVSNNSPTSTGIQSIRFFHMYFFFCFTIKVPTNISDIYTTDNCNLLHKFYDIVRHQIALSGSEAP